MQRIKIEEISDTLTENQLLILAEMLGEIPVSEEWTKCAQKLTDAQKFQIHFKLVALRKSKEKERLDAMTVEEKTADDHKLKDWHQKIDPNEFYGNMGQPETPQEFKNRYGVWPPSYDKDGNKITE